MRFGLARYFALGLACVLAPALADAAEVRGTVFDDRNGDGVDQSAEAGLPAWILYIDADRDGVLDNPAGNGTCTAAATDTCIVTDANGGFRFAALPVGAVQLRLVPQSGWARTTDDFIDLVLEQEQIVDQIPFGVFRLGIATGVVFEDVDGDGRRDEGERGLPRFTAYADGDLDDRFDTGEPSGLSDADGTFAVDGLSLGAHALLLQTRCGFVQTLPAAPSRYVLTIATGSQIIPDRNFGVRPPDALPGDGNGDGVVSAADLVAVAQLIGGPPVNGGDANQDGSVTAADLPATAANAFACADIAFDTDVATPTATASPIDTPTVPGATATATGAATATSTATGAATATVTFTSLPATPTATTVAASPTATATAVSTATATAVPTNTATVQPTATLSRTPTATTAPAGPDPAALAGTAAQIANGMNAIPAVITALVSGVQFGSLVFDPEDALTSGIGGPAGACPSGGTATRGCSGGAGNAVLAIDFASCKVPTASGSVTIDALPPADPAISLRGSLCAGNLSLPPWTANLGVSAVFRDASNGPLLTATAALTGTINPSLGGSCQATGATMTISGTIRTQFADGSVTAIAFTNTGVVVAVQQFNAQCVPLRYTMTFNGPGTVTVSPPPALTFGGPADSSTAVTFTNFVVTQNATASPTLTELDGGLGPACGGPALTLDTTEALAQVVGQQCPTDGTLRVVAGAATTQLFYLTGGAVGLDANNDGVAESQLTSCREAPPLCEAGGNTPTATRTASATATRTATPLVPATTTSTPTVSPTPTVTHTVPAGSTATATRTLTATATRTVTITPTPSATPTPTASPLPAPEMICDTLSGPAPIPDANATGINNTIVVPSGPALADLNVYLAIGHTWPGDLRVTLTHVDTGTTVTLLDRPGAPATVNGCGMDDFSVRNDIEAVFDDTSLRLAEDRCANSPPATATIDGSVRPTQLLSAFNGQSLAGSWRLNVADLVTQDTGSLVGWCLLPNSHDPVVSDFTCDEDQSECVLVVDQDFELAFSYSDPDGDAATWEITARRDDGFEFDAGGGSLQFGSGGTVSIPFNPFTCPTADCPDSDFDYTVVVRDQAGHESPPQRLRLTVVLIGA